MKSNPIMTVGLVQSVRERLGFTTTGVLSANAAFLLSIALLAMFAGGDEPSPWAIVAVGVILGFGGWGISLALRFVADQKFPGSMAQFVPFATVMAVAGTTLAVIGIAIASVEDSRSVSTSVAWWPYLLLSVLLLGLWLAPGLQGRPFILGSSLLTFTWAVTGLVAVIANERELKYSAESFLSTDGYYYNPQDVFRSASAAGLFIGIIFLLTVLTFDWLGWRGLATPFLVAGVTATLMGAFGIASNASVLSILFLAVCIVMVILVGVLGRRKATVWLGGVLLAPALIVACVRLLGDDPNHIVVAIFVAIVGIAVLVASGVAYLYGPAIMAKYDASLANRHTADTNS